MDPGTPLTFLIKLPESFGAGQTLSPLKPAAPPGRGQVGAGAPQILLEVNERLMFRLSRGKLLLWSFPGFTPTSALGSPAPAGLGRQESIRVYFRVKPVL